MDLTKAEGEHLAAALKAGRELEAADPEIGRRRQKRAEDLTAMAARIRHNPQGCGLQEELIRDARAYAFATEAGTEKERYRVSVRLFEKFIPDHPKFRKALFKLGLEELHAAVWNEGDPSLRESWQPQASSVNLTEEGDKNCAAPRGAWLDRECAKPGINIGSDFELSQKPGAPSYKTISGWRDGKTTHQTRQTRMKLSKVLNVEFSEVPE